ncbi:gluconokinase [Robiginitalea sp. IMCC43444]|uniref:gluconokinase n=1 Tax=Robiginitalea sp. IMCC43444 TaxID=3459121 RepID=UPI0040439291
MQGKPKIYFITGVSGSGKSTVGRVLAEQLHLDFRDGDDFHPEANIAKMAGGSPLNDQDRYGWLLRLNELAQSYTEKGVVIACSALKEKYRQWLSKDISCTVCWVLLQGSEALLRDRLRARKDHFMPDSLLQSQLDTLEVPNYGLKLPVTLSPSEIVSRICNECP